VKHLFDIEPRLDTHPLLVGVVHLLPLPGAPLYKGSMEQILAAARFDADALRLGGCDAVIVENFGDTPFYPDKVPGETIASMALALAEVRDVCGMLPVGVNVLRNDAPAALGICAATGASFMRVNVHTSAAVTDQGILQGQAAWTMRERERLCPGVAVLADVHVKHASPLGSESAAEAAGDAFQRGMADAIIITGTGTGRSPSGEVLSHVRRTIGKRPILIGSGLTDANAQRLLESADGAIVGTWFKKDGDVTRVVDLDRVRRLRELVDSF
jgi:membrane complex biogenesis BtpA family protein